MNLPDQQLLDAPAAPRLWEGDLIPKLSSILEEFDLPIESPQEMPIYRRTSSLGLPLALTREAAYLSRLDGLPDRLRRAGPALEPHTDLSAFHLHLPLRQRRRVGFRR